MKEEILEQLIEDLQPYEGATEMEHDELLYNLINTASYASYFKTEKFMDALIDELQATKEDYEENFEWIEEPVTVTVTVKKLVMK